MADDEEYERALRDAERQLASAATAADVRRIWHAHLGVLGHRTLGRLLLGQPADRLLNRRIDRAAGGE